jgi:DNA-binding response OmpR family regulator
MLRLDASSGTAWGLRILVVEDDEDFRELLAEALRGTGSHAITVAADVRSGLGCLRDESYDLLVTDIQLRDGSGLVMLDDAKAEGRLAGTAVVVCSGNQWLRRQALDRGATFILKPAGPEKLFAVVRLIRSFGERKRRDR